MTDAPWWVDESVTTFEQPTRVGEFTESWGTEWVEHTPETFSTIRSIHYPPRVHVFFVVDSLQEDGTWLELDGTHYSEELAENAAKRRAYNNRNPHRVRMVASHE